ncbi:MAG: NAD(P)/FAD-dependent oxidoreductase [Lachnospiraceae bacterium]|nr:NAD(P)/FAD-dependent oxidoreductase [Lachnospiraceae bacterium]
MSKVIVVGGGAAGMMAAITAAQNGHQVTLLEKNEKLGKKLFITGKGRCNVTNAADMEVLFANVCTNEKFLYSAFYQYDNKAIMSFLEKAGCPLKIERGDRVFPVSDHSSDVIAAFQRELRKLNVNIMLNTEVKNILTEPMEQEYAGDNEESRSGRKGKEAGQRIRGVVLSDERTIHADACILCTGGLSYASTGSTGDGHHFAEESGHKVTECQPALVPLETSETWCRDLMGLSLKNVSLRMTNGKKELYSEFGEMLFTHFGVSGPLVLSASSFYKKPKNGEMKLYIDLKPALDAEQLDKRILRDFEESKNKQFKNALNGLFPTRLIPVMIQLSGIDPEKKVNEVTREERRSFGELIKNLPLTVTGTRPFAEAIITKGGVSVKDVNPSTMESKKVSGLYFAGELLDLDALTGGFNLQIAWSTGYLAGSSIK